MRSGKDYYQAWDKYASQAVQEIQADSDDEQPASNGHDARTTGAAAAGAGTGARPGVPKPHTSGAAAAAGGAGAAGGVGGAGPGLGAAGLKGPALTQWLIELNQGLTEEEKRFNANNEKAKGNEFFR